MPSAARTKRWLDLARGLLGRPTAPLFEAAPARFVLDFAAARPGLFCQRDAAGNILLGYPRRGAAARAPLVLVAHLDHPGFAVEAVRNGTAWLRMRGGVGMEHVRPGGGVRFYRRGEDRASGCGRLVRLAGVRGRLRRATARVVSGRAVTGGFAVWDFPACALRRGRIAARGCDDLLGSAALLCLLDELARRGARAGPVWTLFTRAEECGFYGAFRAAEAHWLPRAARVVSVECSRALPAAPLGSGVIVRVGDRTRVFDPGLSEALRQVCERLHRRNPEFRYQRRLMDGGTCEATVFAAAGYRAAGLALPLANYHNQAGLDGGRPGLAPEQVAIPDFLGLVRALLALARVGRGWRRQELAGEMRFAGLAHRARRALAAHPLEV